MPSVLFVCGRNKRRSPTAEKLFSNRSRVKVSSAGLSPKSPRTLSERDLVWADVVYVMEREHKKRIVAMFGNRIALPPISSLDIPDSFGFMDPELVSLLETQVGPLLTDMLGTI